jgi:hypothetical protein
MNRAIKGSEWRKAVMAAVLLSSCVGLGVAIAQQSGSASKTVGAAAEPNPTALPPLPPNVLPVDPLLSAAVSGGATWRVAGPRGPLRVWQPAGYHPDGAATVLYLHGFYNDVDSAWREHQLPEQFARAGINALFIAVETPSSGRQGVSYPNMAEVLQIVERETGTMRGTGPLVAMGHSGAFRTMMAWLDEPMLDTVMLLDALYGENDAFTEWYNASKQHRMVNVGDDTLRWTEVIAMDTDAVTVDYFPTASLGWTPSARDARHLYVRSQFSHMQIVTAGVAIPLLLRLLPVEVLATSPWQLPIVPLRGPPIIAAPPAASK